MKYFLMMGLLLTCGCEPSAAKRPLKIDTSVPKDGYRKIVSGAQHTCALVNGGRVLCWGATGSQQLGVDEKGRTVQSYAPRYIQQINDAVDIAAGVTHTCVVRETGGVSCFGDDGSADGFWDVAIEDARRVAIAEGSTCVIVGSGVSCWGKNTHGQVPGPSKTRISDPTPVQIKGALEIIGGGKSFAVRTQKGWTAWGDNSKGLLVREQKESKGKPGSFTPPVSNALVFSTSFACGSDTSKTTCWGELGAEKARAPEEVLKTNSPETEVSASRDVQGLKAVEKISLGKTHGCALDVGAIYCWGQNGQGGLGDGTTKHRAEAKPVLDLKSMTDVSTGSFFSCGTDGAKIWCWGNNDFGQIGDPIRISKLVPVLVSPPTP